MKFTQGLTYDEKLLVFPYLGIFRLEYEKTIVIFEISTLVFFNIYKKFHAKVKILKLG